jgi:mRNA interferase MazF
MEKLVKGDVVVIPFPFSDLSQAKKRPALVLASFEKDVLLCMISGVEKKDRYSISLSPADFGEGSLNRQSWVRIHRLFTAEKTIILSKVGTLKEKKLKEVVDALVNVMRG